MKLKYAQDGTLASIRFDAQLNTVQEIPLLGRDIQLAGLQFAFDDDLWQVCCQNLDNFLFSVLNPESYNLLKTKLRSSSSATLPPREQDDTLVSINQDINRGKYDDIGKGSFATVYRVHTPAGTWAVKVSDYVSISLSLAHLTHSHSWQRVAKRAFFEREIDALVRCNLMANIIRVCDFGTRRHGLFVSCSCVHVSATQVACDRGQGTHGIRVHASGNTPQEHLRFRQEVFGRLCPSCIVCHVHRTALLARNRYYPL
jgi:hypothetical protein